MSVVANAYLADVTFSGADIVAQATNNPLTTPAVGDGYIALPTGTIKTYGSSADAYSFNKWLDTLNEGYGIRSFNLWLQDGHSNQAAMWGETIALNDAYADNIIGYAPTGWTAEIVTCPDSWGAWWAGRKLITFYTEDENYYLRPGTELTFGFQADIIGNDGATGPNYNMWVGSSDVIGTSNEGLFQRSVNATATAVPGPAAVLPFIGGLIVAARKRRK